MSAKVSKKISDPPSIADVSIWRYMDLAKFLSMLCDEALYFCQAELMDDNFEGSISEENYKQYVKRYEANPQRFAPPGQELFRGLRKHIYLNCWHMNEHESAAMWSLYGSAEGAIAIRTTFEKLANLLPDDASLGLVSYVDYSTDLIPERDVRDLYMHKRRSFAHEQEVRAVIVNIPSAGDEKNLLVPIGSPGIKIPVNLNLLIDSIYLSPKAPEWYKDVLSNVLKKYDIKIDFTQSSLNYSPIF